MSAASGAPARIEELESLRGLAALLVVLYHMPKWHPVLDLPIINNGYLMVELFFVLSGFVIFNAYAGRIANGRDLLRFQFLRLGRLYPVHLVFLFAFVLIELAKYLAVTRLGMASPNGIVPFSVNNLDAFIKQLLLVSSALPHQPQTYNVPAWSISVEFYTYLVFGLCSLYGGRGRTPLCALLAAAALGLLATGSGAGFETLLRCFAGFFIGCLTAAATGTGAPARGAAHTEHAAPAARAILPAIVPLAAFAALVAFLHLKRDPAQDLWIYFLTAALIVALVRSGPGALKAVLNLRGLTWLGAISYLVYMSHAAIEWVANQAVRHVLRRPEAPGPDGASTPQLSAPEALLVSAAVVACVLLVSALVYRWVEQPWRERSRRFAFGRWPQASVKN